MKLVEGKEYKVGIRDGKLGCSDAQDAYKEHGHLLLFKKGDNYMIDTPDGENIVFVDDVDYINCIVVFLDPTDFM